MINTPVMIIGGGPVGLTLALCLSLQGIRSTIINDRLTTTTHPKLDVVNCRSMEIYRQLGLSEKIRAAGNPLDANQISAFAASASGPFFSVMSDRHFIYRPVADANKAIRASRDGAFPLESMQRIAQMHLEPVLLDEARRDPNIDVQMGWRLYGFDQDETGVTAMAHHVETGTVCQYRSDYLIGCDGPASRVRNFLNIDYDGTRDLLGELFIIHFRSDEIAALYPNGQPYWHTWISRPGFSGLLVSPDASRNDYVLHRPVVPKLNERLETIVAAALGTELKFEIIQSGPWRPQFLVAQSFGRDRVFLAGDATHQYMPTGGLGMNTGITEAHNLAWKIAAVLNGWGGARLMATYEDERLPIARRNRQHVRQCAAAAFEANFPKTDALLDQTPSGAAERALMGSTFEEKVSRLYESMGIEIGYRYDQSSIIAREQGPAPDYPEIDYIPSTWPGARLPSTYLANGAALFDLLSASGFTLVVNGNSPDTGEMEKLSTAATVRNVPLAVVHIGNPDLEPVYERQYLLVRPDQHVCWRGNSLPHDPGKLLDQVRGY